MQYPTIDSEVALQAVLLLSKFHEIISRYFDLEKIISDNEYKYSSLWHNRNFSWLQAPCSYKDNDILFLHYYLAHLVCEFHWKMWLFESVAVVWHIQISGQCRSILKHCCSWSKGGVPLLCRHRKQNRCGRFNQPWQRECLQAYVLGSVCMEIVDISSVPAVIIRWCP